MPVNHAMLSPSSAHRWLHCTPSALLEKSFSDTSSPASAEGTAAHALADHKVKRALKRRSKRPVSDYNTDEMEECTDDYRDFVMEQLGKERQTCSDAQAYTEIELDLSAYIPHGFGTSDCIIVSDNRMHVIDLKYGQGVLVGSEENPQMMLYALGALDLFGDLYNFEEVSLTIFQPRRDNISTWNTTVSHLREWADEVLKPKVALANEGLGDYCSGDWCRFCKAAVKCRARAEKQLALAKYEFQKPPLLSDEEIDEILPDLDPLMKWAEDLMQYATDEAAEHGKKWKTYKLVEGRSKRKYTDEQAVSEAAKNAGYTDIYRRSLIPITEMERLMGKKTFHEVLGGLVMKPPGKPMLVPRSDGRPEIMADDVHNEFKEEI